MVRKVAGEDVKRPSDVSARFARIKRRAEVAELYLKGQTQLQIGEALKISTATVASDLQTIMKEWIKESTIKFEERKAKELAKIDHIEAMAWRGWELSIERQEVHRSLKEQVRQQVRDSENKVTGHRMVPVRVTEEVTIKGQSGDPRFLEQAARCVEMRLRILGLWKADTIHQNQMILDWTGLFKAQAERARLANEDHERQRLGYGRGVMEVIPKAIPMNAGSTEEAEPGGSLPNPLPFPPEEPLDHDPIEARIREEERQARIQLPPEEGNL